MFHELMLLGILFTLQSTFASPLAREELREGRQQPGGTLDQALQNLWDVQKRPNQQGFNRPGSSSNSGQESDGAFNNGGGNPNFGFTGASNNQRPSSSGNNNQDFDIFNGPGWGNENQASTAANNQQQRPASGGTTQGFDPFNGPGWGNENQPSSGGTNNQLGSGSSNSGNVNQGASAGFENGSQQQGSGGGNQQQGAGQQWTTVRSPLNVVSNENTVAEATCIRQCQTINNYDPVCGSDNITYSNRGKFRCAQQCGRAVQEVYRGSCVTPAPN